MRPKLLGSLAKYLGEVKFELSKITWPKREDIVKLTLVVILISMVIGLYLGVLDFGFTKLLESIFSKK